MEADGGKGLEGRERKGKGKDGELDKNARRGRQIKTESGVGVRREAKLKKQ